MAKDDEYLTNGYKLNPGDSGLLDQFKLDSMDYWRLCDELTILQAALLVAGEDPATSHAYVENWTIEQRPIGYEAAKTAITHALRKGTIIGNIEPMYEGDINGNQYPIEGTISVASSTVDVESLRDMLKRRGLRTGFFFPTESDSPDYLDSRHPRYAPKLAAAVSAWTAVTDPGKISPKKALEKWLREHAAMFGMTDDEGNPVNQAIEDCSKVANWQPGGGAPKTP